MKFTCIPDLGKQGGGKVWDAEQNAVIAVFDQNGEFETEDAGVIAKLKARGFREIGGAPIPAKQGIDDEPEATRGEIFVAKPRGKRK